MRRRTAPGRLHPRAPTAGRPGQGIGPPGDTPPARTRPAGRRGPARPTLNSARDQPTGGGAQCRRDRGRSGVSPATRLAPGVVGGCPPAGHPGDGRHLRLVCDRRSGHREHPAGHVRRLRGIRDAGDVGVRRHPTGQGAGPSGPGPHRDRPDRDRHARVRLHCGGRHRHGGGGVRGPLRRVARAECGRRRSGRPPGLRAPGGNARRRGHDPRPTRRMVVGFGRRHRGRAGPVPPSTADRLRARPPWRPPWPTKSMPRPRGHQTAISGRHR